MTDHCPGCLNAGLCLANYLHAEIERLMAALQEIEALDDRTISDSGKIMRALMIARRALENKP